jgi:hypothetical protein
LPIKAEDVAPALKCALSPSTNGFGDEVVIKRERDAHRLGPALAWDVASIDAESNARASGMAQGLSVMRPWSAGRNAPRLSLSQGSSEPFGRRPSAVASLIGVPFMAI